MTLAAAHCRAVVTGPREKDDVLPLLRADLRGAPLPAACR